MYDQMYFVTGLFYKMYIWSYIVYAFNYILFIYPIYNLYHVRQFVETNNFPC